MINKFKDYLESMEEYAITYDFKGLIDLFIDGLDVDYNELIGEIGTITFNELYSIYGRGIDRMNLESLLLRYYKECLYIDYEHSKVLQDEFIKFLVRKSKLKLNNKAMDLLLEYIDRDNIDMQEIFNTYDFLINKGLI